MVEIDDDKPAIGVHRADHRLAIGRWGVSAKLWLGFGALMLVVVVAGLVSSLYINQIDQKLRQIVEVEDAAEQAVLEMKDNATETALAVLNYVRDQDPKHLKTIRDSEAEFERFAAVYHVFAETKEERRLGRKVAEQYGVFKLLGDEIVFLVDQRNASLVSFRRMISKIHALIEDKLRKSVDMTAPHGMAKFHAALEMDINIYEAFTAILAYVAGPSPALREETRNAEADFERSAASYRRQGLSAAAVGWLDAVDRTFADAVKVGNRILNGTDELNQKLEKFARDLGTIGTILDDRIQPLIHAERIRAAADAKASTDTAAILLLVIGIIALVVGSGSAWALSRGIVTPVRALVSGMEIIGQGKLTHRIDIKNRDEFRLLATGFNRMAEKIQKASLTDTTERKRAEEEAAEKSVLLEATFQNMAQGITVFGSDDALVTFNPQYAEITGLPADFLHIGLNRKELIRFRAEQGHFVGTEAEADAAIEERFVVAKQPESGSRTLPDGRSFSYQRTPTPDGGYISTVTDITEAKLAEEQLHQAQKMEAVGQLTGGIAHDFNNILAVSLGNLELAEEAAEAGGDVKTFLATIKRATERGASLTNQLLAFSRKQTLFPQVIDAGELVDGITGLLRRSLGETIEIKVIANDDLWPCEVDPHQLESALLNLALNARDAMPGGGKLIIGTTNISLDDDTAAAQTEVVPGEYVMVAVTDTGAGMAQEVIDHAFDPFFTTKEVGRGSGLGLSMVYGFVKQSGGHVTIYSAEGKGTTVKLYLPRSGKAGKRVEGPDLEDVPQARGETVLVVEDDPDVRTLSVALLSSFGYEILEAADGKTALKVLASAPRANLLFTDVVLPGGMSGPELAAEVQSRVPGMAVLYTSGYTDLANFGEDIFGEDTGLLQKPYRKADLAQKVRRALDQAKA